MTRQQLRAQANRVLGANSTRSTAGQLALAVIEFLKTEGPFRTHDEDLQGALEEDDRARTLASDIKEDR